MEMNEKQHEAYRTYVEKGRVSRLQLNTLCGIGVFIFGWLQVIVYQKLGRSGLGWGFLIPVMLCFSLGRQINEGFFVLAALIYLAGWITANVILSKYQELDHAIIDKEAQQPREAEAVKQEV